MVPGVFTATDEALTAANEARLAATTNHKFGQGVDFKLGDAMWSDFAQRYYDPFAYKTNAQGKQVFQGYWAGHTTADSWQKFGNKVAMDPVTYALDVSSLIPVVGWVAKGADVASIAAKVGRGAGIAAKAGEAARAAEATQAGAASEAAAATKNMPRIGVEHLTMDEHAAYLDAHNAWLNAGTDAFKAAHDTIVASPVQTAAEAKVQAALDLGMDPADPKFPTTPLNTLNDLHANQAIHGLPEPMPYDFAQPRLLDSAQSVLDSVRANPNLIGVLDETQIRNAAAIVEHSRATTALTEADAALLDASAAYRNAPSVRTFRRVARSAIAGDTLAQDTMAKWKTLGYEFNNAENAVTLKFSAKFEARTKVLEAPPNSVLQSDIAIIRLPASPLARGIKEATLWVGKYIVDPVGGKVGEAGAASGSRTVARLTSKFVDFPRLGYRWNYTKAVQDAMASDWGDVAPEMRFAGDNYKLAAHSDLPAPLQEALLSELYGTFIPGSEDQAAALLANRERLLAEDIGTIYERAASFDEFYQSHRLDIRRRLADSTYKAADPNLDKAVILYRRIQRQRENISNRLVHTETSPGNVEALRHIYVEAMHGLQILPEHLFGDGVKGFGKIGKFVDRVVQFNGSLIPHTSGLYGTPDVAATMKSEWVKFVRHITGQDSSAGLFRRGDAHPNAEAAPIAVLADSQKGVPKGFTRIHLPKLRHTIDGPNLELGKIIDKQEAFIVPNETLITRGVGKGARKVHVLDATSGRDMLETGSLNAMSDIYPQARFYSEKVGENGLMGVRQNEAQLKNEHVVATSGLREHSLAIAVRSELNHYIARMHDSLIKQAEENAVFVPAERVVGKTSADSGYRVLKMVQSFDNLQEAMAFARLRGVEKLANDALNAEPVRVNNIVNAPEGLSRIMVNGQEHFIVRGTVHDWARGAGNEDLASHSIMSDYVDRNYADPNNIGHRGMVIAIPNGVDHKLSMMVLDGNNYATTLLDNPWVGGTTSVFKRIVLNMRLGFIDANVVGGSAMLMMRNPMAAGKTVARMMAKNGWIAKDSAMANWAGDSAAVDRPLAWEQDHNIYRQDSGIGAGMHEPNNLLDFSSKSQWIKKYIWNGGYTTVAAFERQVRNAVAVDFLTSDPAFKAFMNGPEVAKYVRDGVDFTGEIRGADNPISKFEASCDILLDRNSPLFNADLKHRMRYVTNTVSGNYHRFSGFETMLRNFAMPFYAWQRHSLAYTWRMAVDKPITANALYKVGQQGYSQVAEQGLPDYLRQTIPVPTVLKSYLGFLPKDFRIDASNINPFGTATSLVSSLYSVMQGDNMGNSIFQFAKDQLGIDPVTKRIDWARLSTQDQNGGGIWNSTLGMFGKISQSTVFGSAVKVADAVDNSYQQDSLANQYPAIESGADALKILDHQYTTDAQGNPVSKGMTGWSLDIPNQKTTQPSNRAMDIINAAGFKSYDLNSTSLNDQSRKEHVAAMALAFYNNKKMADNAVRDMGKTQSWQAKRDYVTQVWLPQARAQGIDEATIQVVLIKLNMEKPKGGAAVDPNLLLATMGG